MENKKQQQNLIETLNKIAEESLEKKTGKKLISTNINIARILMGITQEIIELLDNTDPIGCWSCQF